MEPGAAKEAAAKDTAAGFNLHTYSIGKCGEHHERIERANEWNTMPQMKNDPKSKTTGLTRRIVRLMPTISEAEKQERRFAIESVIGTHTAEGIVLDPTVRLIMDRFIAGELDLSQFSAAMQRHAQTVGEVILAGAA